MKKSHIGQIQANSQPLLNLKSCRSKIALALAVVMTVANAMPVSAVTVGKPSKNKKAVEVTFQAGEGGYFDSLDGESSSRSNASKSSANRTKWVQSFYDLEKDDQGYYTNLMLGAEELEEDGKEPVWKSIVNTANQNEDKEDDLAFAGWYDQSGNSPVLVSDFKEIYGNATLTAQWYDPKQIQGEIAEDYQLVAVGLGNRKLISSKIEKERSTEELEKWAEKELSEKKLGIDGEGVFAFSLKITGKGKTTITMTLPENCLDVSNTITAIQEKDNEKIEILPVDVVKADNGEKYKMTFTTEEGGAFYFVNTGIFRGLMVSEPVQKAAGNGAVRAADEGTFENGLTWKLENNVLTISGTGAMPDRERSDSSLWNSYQVEKIVIETGVTSIGNYAFARHTNLEEVTIPDGVTRIGEYAFYRCGKLASINIPDSVSAIGEQAFYGCESISDVIPVGKGVCGQNLKWEVDSQGKLTISGKGEMPDWDNWGSTAPWYAYKRSIEKVVIEEGVTSIGNYSFYYYEALTSAEIPESVTRIGNSAFYRCTSLTKADVPGKQVSIGEYAFYDCNNLTSVITIKRESFGEGFTWELTNQGTLTISGTGEMPEWENKWSGMPWYSVKSNIKNVVIKEGVTSISGSSFLRCNKIISVEIPAQVKRIGEAAFSDCSSLESVQLPNGLTKIDERGFYGCSSLAKLELPDSITEIGSAAFYGCSSLTDIKIPNQVARIESEVFHDCTSLSKVELPEGLTRIESLAFRGTAVVSAVIPKSVTFLAQTAFPKETSFTYRKLEDIASVALKETGGKITNTANQHSQNYSWNSGTVVNSNLYEGENGTFYRVEYAANQVVIEQYGADQAIIESWKVPMELPKFGGFYAGSDALYMVFGQDNEAESDDVEVVRIVKYSKDMERLDSASLFGMNTTIPFRAGSLRMVENDRDLHIRMSHQMYKSDDGLNHQANMTIIINKESMIVSYCGYLVSRDSVGYVSHSFNQFVRIDGDNVVAVDHGDAYPRSVVMHVYPAEDVLESEKRITILSIPGSTGNNYTGVTVGGLEVSDSCYLVAGTAVDLDDFASSKTKNVFLAVVNKDELPEKADCIDVTDYVEGGAYQASNPQLIKLSDDLFAVMWEECNERSTPTGTVKIAYFNGSGERLGGEQKVQRFTGKLSDCQPIRLAGNVVWYVTDGSNLTFYTYPAGNPDFTKEIEVTVKSWKGSGGSSGSGSGAGGSGSGGSGGSGGGSGGSGGGGGGGGGSSRGGSSGGSGGPGSSSVSTSVPVLTGAWLKDGIGWWLVMADGSYPRNQWARINGAVYHFNEIGYMTEGWFAESGRWYYLIPGNGAMATGWIQLGEIWYYLNADGAMAVGWIQDPNSGKWYYLGTDGAMLVNTITPDGYVIGADGAWIQ